MSKGIEIKIDFEGFPEVVRKLKSLEDDIAKRRTLLPLFKKQSQPYLRAAKKTSFGDNVHEPVKRFGVSYDYGNLSRSMRTFNNRRNPSGVIAVHTGPQTKKREGSGYYGYMVMPETKAKHIKKPLDWKNKAWRQAEAEVENGISNELAKYVKSKAKRGGWDVD